MITLVATLVCLAAVGTSICFFTREEEPEVSETAPEPEASAENEEPENVSDGLILTLGGTFSMGSVLSVLFSFAEKFQKKGLSLSSVGSIRKT